MSILVTATLGAGDITASSGVGTASVGGDTCLVLTDPTPAPAGGSFIELTWALPGTLPTGAELCMIMAPGEWNRIESLGGPDDAYVTMSYDILDAGSVSIGSGQFSESFVFPSGTLIPAGGSLVIRYEWQEVPLALHDWVAGCGDAGFFHIVYDDQSVVIANRIYGARGRLIKIKRGEP